MIIDRRGAIPCTFKEERMQIKTIEDLKKMTKERLLEEYTNRTEEVGNLEAEIARLHEAFRQNHERHTDEIARKNTEIDALTLAIRKICKEQ